MIIQKNGPLITQSQELETRALPQFPETLSDMTLLKKYLSTNRTWLVEIEGSKYILKAAESNAASKHMRATYEALKTYEALGVPVPAAKCYTVESGFTFPDGTHPENAMPIVLMEYLEGELLCDLLRREFSAADAAYLALSQNSYIDILIGNWDFPGLLRNNAIQVGGSWYRLDFGSAFEYNFDGKQKAELDFIKDPRAQFTKDPVEMLELEILMDPYFKLFSFDVVSKLSFDDLIAQALRLDTGKLQQLVASGELSKERYEILLARHEDFITNCFRYKEVYEPKWNVWKEERQKVLTSERLIPDFKTNSMEAAAVAQGLHQPYYSPQGEIGHNRPVDPRWELAEGQKAVVGLILTELGTGEIIITQGNRLITKPIDPKEIKEGAVYKPCMRATFALGRSAGFRIGVTGDFLVTKDQEGVSKRFYTAARAGGAVTDTCGYKRCSLQEALTLISDPFERSLLEEYAASRKR